MGAYYLLACALGAPELKIIQSVPLNRWSAPLGDAFELALGSEDATKLSRLQILRRVVDLQADGRWAIAIPEHDHAGLLGPLYVARGTPARLTDCLASWPHQAFLRRIFQWIDGQRVDQTLVVRYPGASRDTVLDPAPPMPLALQDLEFAAQTLNDAHDSLRVAVAAYKCLLDASKFKGRPLGTAEHLFEVPDALNDEAHSGLRLRPSNWRLGGDIPASGRSGSGNGETAEIDDVAETPTDVAQTNSTEVLLKKYSNTTLDVPLNDLKRINLQTEKTGLIQYDEWDYVRQNFRKGWTSVREQIVHGENILYRANVLAKHPSIARQIRSQLVQVRANAAMQQRRLKDGDQIDTGAVIQQVVARRQGQQVAEEFVYQSRLRSARELSVLVLLDISASTGYPVPGKAREAIPAFDPPSDGSDDLFWQSEPTVMNAEPARRVIDVQKDAVALLCEAFHSLGDRHAVLAFSGKGRNNIDVLQVKDFNDSWSATTAAGLDSLQPQGSTRTGAAVRHAVARLRAEPNRRKLLLVLSDGYPQDSDYGYSVNDIEYGVQDTAHAIREGSLVGIDVFNVSVDVAATDYLSRICPKNRYWVITDVSALPGKMMDLCRLII